MRVERAYSSTAQEFRTVFVGWVGGHVDFTPLVNRRYHTEQNSLSQIPLQ